MTTRQSYAFLALIAVAVGEAAAIVFVFKRGRAHA